MGRVGCSQINGLPSPWKTANSRLRKMAIILLILTRFKNNKTGGSGLINGIIIAYLRDHNRPG